MAGTANPDLRTNDAGRTSTLEADKVQRGPGAKPSICFVAPAAYPILAGDRRIPVVGGAEVQQTLLARGFARLGHKVSLISLDYGQDDGIQIDGVTIYRTHAPEAGIPGLRFFHPRLTSLWQAMKRADADIYYQRASGALTAFTVAFARQHRRLSVYASASDRDFLAQSPLPYWRDRQLFHWAVRHVDLVVTQSEAQRATLAANFARDAAVVKSCHDFHGNPGRQDGAILWVGNMRTVKQPEKFIELARKLPEHRFKMIGGVDERDLAPLRSLAADLRNIEFAGFVPYADIEAHFDGASLLVNTSTNEGFPNTFLQAWSRGIPTISLFDPGTYADGQRVGEVVSSIDEMAAKIAALKSSPTEWQRLGGLAKAYFSSHFTVAQAVASYQRCFRQALARSRAQA